MLISLINKIFLVKEMRSSSAEIHSLRWTLFKIPYFRVYLHKIYLPDYNSHPYTYPWSFISVMLKGKCYKRSFYPPKFNLPIDNFYEAPCVIKHHRDDAHHIEKIVCPVWTLMFAYGKYKNWGYRIEGRPQSGFINWIKHTTYKKLKSKNILDTYCEFLKRKSFD